MSFSKGKKGKEGKKRPKKAEKTRTHLRTLDGCVRCFLAHRPKKMKKDEKIYKKV